MYLLCGRNSTYGVGHTEQVVMERQVCYISRLSSHCKFVIKYIEIGIHYVMYVRLSKITTVIISRVLIIYR